VFNSAFKVFSFSVLTVQYRRSRCSGSNGQTVQSRRYIHPYKNKKTDTLEIPAFPIEIDLQTKDEITSGRDNYSGQAEIHISGQILEIISGSPVEIKGSVILTEISMKISCDLWSLI